MTTPAKIVCDLCSFKYYHDPEIRITSAALPEFMPDDEHVSLLVCPRLPPPNPFVPYRTEPCSDCNERVAVSLSSDWLLEE